ncbi:hypothetical protein [Pantoea dispersa]|uniref:hypothetical protein n=1 Tax=Pantoea dispersa TaxID=59814 RepID=UPI00123B3BE1|nr:hypothetical protein [Pantoea dispersa]KAA8672195.1 hypothetical protein F4W08_07730 [Pantoea dispersa]
MTDTLQTADDQKSPELLQKEAHVKALASIAQAEQEPTPVDVVSFRSEWDAGTGRMKLVPVTQADTDDTIADKLQAEAELFNAMQREAQQRDAEDHQQSFDQLFPSEQRLRVEEYFTPIIKKLTADHIAACDAVSDFEADELRYRAQIQSKWAYELRHTEIKTMFAAGEYHFNTMLKDGLYNIEGYRLAERRSNGGLSSTLVFLPHGVVNVMAYADSDEAKQFSKVEYDRKLQRLIQKCKNAAVALTQAKQKARDALATIPTFEDLISEAVKRAKK